MNFDARLTEDNDSDTSDHEEEFYYTEIEVTVDTMTQSFADMYTSSPPQTNRFVGVSAALPDHDYQKKKVRMVDTLLLFSIIVYNMVKSASLFPLVSCI